MNATDIDELERVIAGLQVQLQWVLDKLSTLKAAPEATPTYRLRAKPGTQTAKIELLLLKGATTRQILDAVGWDAISVPYYAKYLGYTLHTKKVRRNGRKVLFYWVTASEPRPASNGAAASLPN